MSTMTPEEQDFCKVVEQFAREHIRTGAASGDQQSTLDVDLVRKLGELGVYGLRFPEKYGGSDGSMVATTRVLELIATADAGLASSLIVHLAVGSVVFHLGTEQQRAQYLPGFIAGTSLCGMGITEPDAGSDVRSMRTRAVRDGDQWVIDGQKIYITNGASAAFLIVAAHIEDTGRLGFFIVERGDAGFVVTGTMDKLGVRASETATLFFDSCRVPADRLVGGDSDADGFVVAMEAMSQDRVLAAAVAVGVSARALEEAVHYTREREQFGRPVATFQAVRHTLADLATGVAAGRALVTEAARRVDEGLPYGVEAAMAKLFAGDLVKKVTVEALELHGGFGFMNESVISRLYRDAPINAIAGGTSNIQRDLIARSVTGMRA